MQKAVPNLCDEKKTCCGCGACYTVCPVQAITMKADAKGFLYPFIDEEKCIRCFKCLKSCSFKKHQNER